MDGDVRLRGRPQLPVADPRTSRPRRDTALVLEALESRQLLSVFTGVSRVRNIPAPSGVYSLSLEGPGVLRTSPAGRGTFDVRLLGTTEDSTLTITLVRPRFHVSGGPLQIRNLYIGSGEISSIEAGPAILAGAMTPLDTSPTSLTFGGLGQNARIDVRGSLGALTLGDVDLGPAGQVMIAGDLTGISGSDDTSSTAALSVGRLSIDGGRFVIGRDVLGAAQIAGDVRLQRGGLLSVGRDLTQTLVIDGSVVLDSGGAIVVGRNVAGLGVNGDVLINPGQSGIAVGGNLNNATITGILRGQGSPTTVDLAVGLNLNGLSVLGGTANQGSIQFANINVGKNITGLNAAHGIFQSWVTAGVAISGLTIGADGVTAIYNSEIDAGTSITNVSIIGDVVSGFPGGDASGYPTRIIAGKVRGSGANAGPNQGLYLPNGTISDFNIEGALVDAVLAASVAPFGGDGSLPPAPSYATPPRTCGDPPGIFTNFQAPAGLTDGTTPNYSIRNVGGPNADQAAWVVPVDQRHACVLSNGTIVVTISGGVISTQPDPTNDTYDFAGIFAVNTTGVSG